MKDEIASQDWVSAGLAELAKNGVDGVRVELLAERLGVTKGGFYRRFRDRRALLEAMLETWRDGRVIAIERQVQASGESAVERLRGIFRLYSERANAQGMAIELAIRQWARTNPAAAAAAAKVDAARLKVAARFIGSSDFRLLTPMLAPCFFTRSCSARACCFSARRRADAPAWSRPAPGSCWTSNKSNSAWTRVGERNATSSGFSPARAAWPSCRCFECDTVPY